MSEQINKAPTAKEATKRARKSLADIEKLELPTIAGYRTRVAREDELNKFLDAGYEIVTAGVLKSRNIQNPFASLHSNASEGEAIKIVLNRGIGSSFRQGILVMVEEEIAREHDEYDRARQARIDAAITKNPDKNIFSDLKIT